jgi:hypothetical protein
MSARIVEVTIVLTRRGGLDQVRFTLACAPNVHITEGQVFEIVAPGREPVRATPLSGQVINRSDGTTSARMIGDRNHDFDTVVARLRRLPNVSNIRVNQP